MKWVIEQYGRTLKQFFSNPGIPILFFLVTALWEWEMYVKHKESELLVYFMLAPVPAALLVWTGFALEKKVNVSLVYLIAVIIGIIFLWYFLICKGDITFIPLPKNLCLAF